MKSKQARECLLDAVRITSLFYPGEPGESDLKLEDAKRAVELAEQETEERMRKKAHKIIEEMMDGIFHGDMPRKIADEFIEKLNDE